MSSEIVGRTSDGELTFHQTQFQDEIDNTINTFLEEIQGLYFDKNGTSNLEEFEWDINKITEIRETAEKILKLPDLY